MAREYCWACHAKLKVKEPGPTTGSSPPPETKPAEKPHGAALKVSFGRVALTIVLILLYLRFLTIENYFSPLDHVNLAFHEGGHVLFSLFGRFLMMLGGTITQLAIPIACAIHFRRSKSQPLGFQLALFWTGENLLNVSIYIADARRRVLPLVGAGEHDWAYLLGRIGLLAQNETIAQIVFALGSVLILYSIYRIVRPACSAN
ncbi:hypothetical protein MYX75_03165 [Acidobacteria bacterium AH-259-A15]|nr:hypothetical protein [Acidobacteria bacterium AH-259-A15]